MARVSSTSLLSAPSDLAASPERESSHSTLDKDKLNRKLNIEVN